MAGPYDDESMKGYKVVSTTTTPKSTTTTTPKSTTTTTTVPKKRKHTLATLRKKTKGDPDAMLKEFGF